MTGAVAVSAVVGAAGLGIGLMIGMRRHMAVAMPILLGLACLVVGLWVLTVQPRPGVAERFLSGVWGTAGAAGLAYPLVATVCTVALVPWAFRAEALMAGAWYRRRREFANAPTFYGYELPDRSESMAEVRAVARTPVLFGALSAWSLVLEEFFYRGVLLLAPLQEVTAPAVVVLLGVQAGFYALNHISFGLPAVAGKALLGLLLGAAALTGGLAPALIGHAMYQVLVRRQFTAAPSRRRIRKDV